MVAPGASIKGAPRALPPPAVHMVSTMGDGEGVPEGEVVG